MSFVLIVKVGLLLQTANLQLATTESGKYALEEPIVIKARSWAIGAIR